MRRIYKLTPKHFIFLLVLALISYRVVNPLLINRNAFLTEKNPLCSSNQIIIINGNQQLSLVASSGNGNLSNPYIVENYVIDGNQGLFSISISNTNQYFILKNCTIYNATYGIYINNVLNGIFSQNNVYYNNFSGIFSINSSNNEFNQNFIYNNKLGISFFQSNNNKIYVNQIFLNQDNGIIVNQSNFNEFRGNSLWDNNNSGFYLKDSINCSLLGNSINMHKFAIFLDNSNYSFVVNNSGYENFQNIYESDCEGNYFENNFVESMPIDSKLINIDFTLLLLLIAPFLILVILINFFRAIKINLDSV